MNKLKDTLHKFTPFISLVLFVVAILVVHHEIKIYHWQEIKETLLNIPVGIRFAMIGVTALGYFALSFYDYLALEYAGEKLCYHRVLLTSFLGYAISNNVGHALISGGTMRFRLYSGWGISALSIAKVVLFCAVTYIIGAVTLMVGGYITIHDHSALIHNISPSYLQALNAGGLALLALWWGIIIFYRKPITIRGFRILIPSLSLSVRQTLAAISDLVLASLVLYLPLLHHTGMEFSNFLVLFILAQLSGLISQVPGGIGVFEGTFLFFAGNEGNPPEILASLIAFRFVYFFLPIILAGIVLALYELKAHKWLKHFKTGMG